MSQLKTERNQHWVERAEALNFYPSLDSKQKVTQNRAGPLDVEWSLIGWN